MIIPSATTPDLLTSLFGSIAPSSAATPAGPQLQSGAKGQSPFLQLLDAIAIPLDGITPNVADVADSGSGIRVATDDEPDTAGIAWLFATPPPADSRIVLPSLPSPAFEVPDPTPFPGKLEWPIATARNVATSSADRPDSTSTFRSGIDASELPIEPIAVAPPVPETIWTALDPLPVPPLAVSRSSTPSVPVTRDQPVVAAPVPHRTHHSIEVLPVPRADDIQEPSPRPVARRESIDIDVVERADSVGVPASLQTERSHEIDRTAESAPTPKATWPEAVERVATEAPMELRNEGRAEFHFRITPPEMGPIRIRLASSRGGVTAEVNVASDAVREMVETRLPELRLRLEAAGVSIGSFSVTQDGNSRDESHWAAPEKRDAQPPAGDVKMTAPRGPSVRLGVIDVTV